MAIPVVGKLSIIERNLKDGSGSFVIGELETELGTFGVRNDVLTQFEPGTYEGVFHLVSVFQYRYSSRDKRISFTEIHAELDWEALRIMSEVESISPPSSFTEAAAEAEEAEIEQKREIEAPDTVTAPKFESLYKNTDVDLISSLTKLEEALDASAPCIKLDSSLSRGGCFGEMVKRVKETKLYRFDFATQSWNKI